MTKRLTGFFRVNIFEYLNQSQSEGTGTAYNFLGGVSGVF